MPTFVDAYKKEWKRLILAFSFFVWNSIVIQINLFKGKIMARKIVITSGKGGVGKTYRFGL